MDNQPDHHLPWRNLADGRWHVLTGGEDFTRDPKLVRKAAQMWASRNRYQCNVRGDDRRIILRFTPRVTTAGRPVSW